MPFSITITADSRTQLAEHIAFLYRMVSSTALPLVLPSTEGTLEEAEEVTTHTPSPEPVAVENTPAKRKPRAKKEEAAPAPAAEEKHDEPTLPGIVETPAPESPAEEPAPEVDYAVLRKSVNALAALKGGEAVMAILDQFGVDHANKLTKDQWAEVNTLLVAEMA